MPTKTLGSWLEVKSSIGRWSGGHSPGGRCPTQHRGVWGERCLLLEPPRFCLGADAGGSRPAIPGVSLCE